MDADRLVFRVLGPLAIHGGTGPLTVPGAKRRVLLAHLLLRANQVVRADELVDAIWPTDAPRSARANLQTYVSGLRRVLPPGKDGPRIVTRGTGYLLEAAPDELDSTRFEDLVGAARQEQARGDPERAGALLDDGLRLWRDDPLCDLPDHRAWRTAVGRLVELRLDALELRAAIRVRLGRYAAAAGELRELLDAHPFRESLWEHLIVALSAGGQRAAALETYRQARELFVAELGVEPAQRLTDLHRAVLAGLPVRERGAAPAAQPPVRQLPADIPDFVGRADHLAALRSVLAPVERSAPPVALIIGAPGTGKTTLAVHAAHEVAERFPDGQLYLDLRGCTDSPRAPTHVYREVLRALGVTGPGVPRRSAERAALYRSMLARRRMLLLLDDVADAAHVRDLLPSGGTCAVVVTSRRHLATIPGAHSVVLDAFAAGEARQLLSRVAGSDRVAAEPAEAAAICRACGHLPLAIRVAGAKLAERRTWTLGVLAERLADESRRLGELHADDMWLRASFELSVRQLPAVAATAFRRLGLLTSTALPGWAIGAVLGRADADDVLDALVDANLLQPLGPDASGQPHYRMHDLLHCYAAEAAASEPPDVRRAAVARVTAGWLALAERAGQGLPACVFRPTPGDSARWCPDPAAAARTVRDPMAWFDAERQALVDAVELAARTGLAALAWELAVALVPYFDHRSWYPDWQRSHESALAAVRAAGDLHGEAALLRGIGQIQLYQDRYAEAGRTMRRCWTLSHRVGDRRGAAIAATGLGSVHRITGDFDRAVRHYTDALAELAVIGDDNCEAQVRNAMGMICRDRGDFAEARSWFADALRLALGIGDAHREATVRKEIGALHIDEGRPKPALRQLSLAVATFDALDDMHCAGYALTSIGRAELCLDRPPRARCALDRALSIFRTTGDRRGQTTVLDLLTQLPDAPDLGHHGETISRDHP
ncbi:MAG TPA: BTAD domain-containing putative transcriptional regulator [Actinocatenispora sp.]